MRPREHLMLRRATAAVGAGLVLAVAAPGAPSASAGDQWWVTAFNLAQDHAIADGSGVTVAVLDSTFSPTAPSLVGVDVVPPAANACEVPGGTAAITGDGPAANHATEMVTVLAGRGANGGPLGAAPGAKVLFYNIGTSNAEDYKVVCRTGSGDGYSIADQVAGAAINDAVSKGARVVSMSFGGGNFGAVTQTAILYGERKGVVFVAGTNDHETTSSRIDQPSIFNGVVVVNGATRDVELITDSATGAQDGPLVSIIGPGGDMAVGGYTAPGAWDAGLTINGSSPATAFVSGVLATTLSKWPDATGNQLIQSLARNTGGDEHEPALRGTDGFGWGAVSLTSMLENDPTTYPDENPLLRDGAEPSTSEILEGSTPSSAPPSSSPAPSSSGPASAATSSTPVASPDDAGGVYTGLLVGIGAGVGVLIGVAVIVVFLVTRRRRRRSGPPAGPPGPSWPPAPTW